MQDEQDRSNSRSQTRQDGTTQMGTIRQPIHTQGGRNGRFSSSPMEPIYRFTGNGAIDNYNLISHAYHTQIERNGPTWNSENGIIRRYTNTQRASNEHSPNLLDPQRNVQLLNRTVGPSRNPILTHALNGQYSNSPMEPIYQYTRNGANYNYQLIRQSALIQIERNGQASNSTDVPIWHSSIPTQSAGNGQYSNLPMEPIYRRTSGTIYNYNLISQSYHTQIESNRPSTNSAYGTIRRYIDQRNASSSSQVPLSNGQSSNPTDVQIRNSILTQNAPGLGQSSNSATSGEALAARQKKQLAKKRNPIFKLPTRMIPQEELNDLRCAICFRDAKEFKQLRRPVAKTICGHFYCVPCIYKWGKSSGNCPLCRQRVLRQRNGKIIFHII